MEQLLEISKRRKPRGSKPLDSEEKNNDWVYAEFKLNLNLSLNFNLTTGGARIAAVNNINAIDNNDAANANNNVPAEQPNKRISDISGYTADSSNSASSANTGNIAQLPPNPRFSEISTVTSSSAATEQQREQQPLSPNQLRYLRTKYVNNELLYNVLEYIDQVVSKFELPETDQNSAPSSSQSVQVKRNITPSTGAIPKRSKVEETIFEEEFTTVLFAKSTKFSKYYFPCKHSWVAGDEFVVVFYDQQTKRVPKTHVFKLYCDSPNEKLVMVNKPINNKRCEPVRGLITGCNIVEDEIFFNVISDQTDDNNVHVSYIYLTQDMVDDLAAQQASPLQLPEEIYVKHESRPRLRRPKAQFAEPQPQPEPEPEPAVIAEAPFDAGPSGSQSGSGDAVADCSIVPKPIKKRRVPVECTTTLREELLETDTVEMYRVPLFRLTTVPQFDPPMLPPDWVSTDSGDEDPPNINCPREAIEGCEPESNFFEPEVDTGFSGKTDHVSKKEKKYLGPLRNGLWFQGLAFILTCPNYISSQQLPNKKAKNISRFTTVPFCYNYLVQQITRGGGRVYEHYLLVPIHSRENLFLIAPRPCLTARYIECMARGVTLVTHEWIIGCCRARALVPYLELPLGWSLDTQRYVYRDDRNVDSNLFHSLRMVITKNKRGANSFFNFWGQLMYDFGARVRPLRRRSKLRELIILNEGYTELECPIVVTPVWIVQCILNMKVLKPEPNSDYSLPDEVLDTICEDEKQKKAEEKKDGKDEEKTEEKDDKKEPEEK